jgi:hypothetical protein
VADFLKRGVIGKIVNVVTPVSKHALLAIDVTDTGGGGDNAFESFGGVLVRDAGHSSSLALALNSQIAYLRRTIRRLVRKADCATSFIRQINDAFQARTWPETSARGKILVCLCSPI